MTARFTTSTPDAHYQLSVTYFKSPLLTLLASLDDFTSDNTTPHDICDAYSTLYLRIRGISSSLLQSTANTPILKPISEYSSALARCLQRDIRRALDDPLASSPHVRDATGLSEEAARFAHDMAMLSQYAIQVAAVICRFPALTSLFSRM